VQLCCAEHLDDASTDAWPPAAKYSILQFLFGSFAGEPSPDRSQSLHMVDVNRPAREVHPIEAG